LSREGRSRQDAGPISSANVGLPRLAPQRMERSRKPLAAHAKAERPAAVVSSPGPRGGHRDLVDNAERRCLPPPVVGRFPGRLPSWDSGLRPPDLRPRARGQRRRGGRLLLGLLDCPGGRPPLPRPGPRPLGAQAVSAARARGLRRGDGPLRLRRQRPAAHRCPLHPGVGASLPLALGLHDRRRSGRGPHLPRTAHRTCRAPRVRCRWVLGASPLRCCIERRGAEARPEDSL